jgi:hypothetical protein
MNKTIRIPSGNTNAKTVLIRFKDTELFNKIKEIAEYESRSINKQINHYLKN